MMKRPCLSLFYFAILFGFAFGNVTFGQAPETEVVQVSMRQCGCNHWNCPICRHRQLQQPCPPSGTHVHPAMPLQLPGVALPPTGTIPNSPTPQLPVMPAPSQPQAAPDANATPNTQAPNTEPNVATDNLNTRLSDSDGDDLFAAASATTVRGSNSGSFGDPGLMGDFFGATSNTGSVVTQAFEVYVTGLPTGGGGLDFAFDPGPFNDATLLSGNQLAPITPASDLPQPQVPGFQFSGGTATLVSGSTYRLNYAYARSLTLPTSFSSQRIKLSENSSPVPTNRVFMNYSMFGNVPLNDKGVTVNRFSPGFETLLFSPNRSLEFRAPFATSLSSDLIYDGVTNTQQFEFGNLFVSLKQVLWRRDVNLISAGMSVTAPTADPTQAVDSRGNTLVRINNDSVHLMPFVGGFYKPSKRTFAQGIAQIDADVNGNRVYRSVITQNGPTSQRTSSLQEVGKLQDMTLLYLDANIGAWIYRSEGRGLTGIAPMLEAHYNRSLNKADCIVNNSLGERYQLPIQQYDNLNLVSAVSFEFNQRSRLGFGYVVPVGNGPDRAFDHEARCTFNRYY